MPVEDLMTSTSGMPKDQKPQSLMQMVALVEELEKIVMPVRVLIRTEMYGSIIGILREKCQNRGAGQIPFALDDMPIIEVGLRDTYDWPKRAVGRIDYSDGSEEAMKQSGMLTDFPVMRLEQVNGKSEVVLQIEVLEIIMALREEILRFENMAPSLVRTTQTDEALKQAEFVSGYTHQNDSEQALCVLANVFLNAARVAESEGKEQFSVTLPEDTIKLMISSVKDGNNVVQNLWISDTKFVAVHLTELIEAALAEGALKVDVHELKELADDIHNKSARIIDLESQVRNLTDDLDRARRSQ